MFSIGTPISYTLKASGTDGKIGIALTADGDYEATIEVNDSVVATISKKVSLDSYTKADEELYQYQLTGKLKTENCIRITQTSGGNMRLDYIDLQHDTPTPLDFGTLPQPEYVYRITNQDHHADTAVDMVIIIPTSQKLLAQAERLKAHHEQHDGLSVRIVPADELYNEFSSGTPDATAYRRYMKMMYDRATTDSEKPRYLLLFGDGGWDNRMNTSDWSGYSPDDYLLCYESENSFSQVSCYVSDDFYCLLDDEEVIQEDSGSSTSYKGQPDVAVGRLPARTLDDAKILVDKIISYAQNAYAGNWQNEICRLLGEGTDGGHNDGAVLYVELGEGIVGLEAGTLHALLVEGIAVYKDKCRGLAPLGVCLEGGGIHGDEHVAEISGSAYLVTAYVYLETGNAGQRSVRGAYLGGKIGKCRERIAVNRRHISEKRPGELHTISRVSGKPEYNIL